MRINKSIIVTLATALIAVAGCGSSGEDGVAGTSAGASTTAPAAPAPTGDAGSAAPSGGGEIVMLTIKDFKYQGPESVKAGAQIMVMNEDAVNHTVTAEDKSDFDVTVKAGESVTFTAPSTPGTYKYICTFHPNMTGTLVVT